MSKERENLYNFMATYEKAHNGIKGIEKNKVYQSMVEYMINAERENKYEKD